MSTITLVYIPCGYISQRLKPMWDKVKKQFSVEVNEINGEESPKEVETLGIKGYPTIFRTENGKRIEYEGDRSEESLIKFFNDAKNFSHYSNVVGPIIKSIGEKILNMEDNNDNMLLLFSDILTQKNEIDVKILQYLMEKLNDDKFDKSTVKFEDIKKEYNEKTTEDVCQPMNEKSPLYPMYQWLISKLYNNTLYTSITITEKDDEEFANLITEYYKVEGRSLFVTCSGDKKQLLQFYIHNENYHEFIIENLLRVKQENDILDNLVIIK
jgi:Thioredoxin